MENESYSVFVKTDIAGRVIGVNSSAFLPSTDGWIEIDNGTGERFFHAQGNYLPMPLLNDDGIYQYKLMGYNIVERTAEEMAADVVEDIPTPPPAGGTVIVQPDPEVECRLATVEQSIEMLLEGVTEDE